MATQTTIFLTTRKNYWSRREDVATAAIAPGMLLALDSSGVKPSDVAIGATPRPKFFAVENISVAGGIDTQYTSGENVFYQSCCSGDLIYAQVANGTYTVGTLLEAKANGTLGAVTTGTPFAIVREAKTTTASDNKLTVELL